MLTRRTLIFLLAAVASLTTNRHADAGRFCDWLFGRSQPPVVVGYAPYAAGYAPYAVGYAPAAGQPVIRQRVVMPTAQPVTTPLSTGGPANTAATSGAYQAQRPAYDNPSVYTGLPVIMAPGPTQTSYRLPTAAPVATQAAPVLTQPAPVVMQAAPTVSAYRPVVEAYRQTNNTVPLTRVLRGGAATTSNPFYGTGNVYPNNYQTLRYPAAYPTTAATVVAPQPRGGLSRFFGSWGTNYRSSYYRTPITYYRPVTSVDPVTGTTVTVQQPCTSTVQQLRRTPYNSLFAQGAPLVTPAPSSSCGSGCTSPAAPSTYLGPAVTTTPFSGAQTHGGVGQVGGIASPSDRNVMPIPSTDPSYLQQPAYPQTPGYTPNTQPLTGPPPTTGGSGDLQPVPQPQMESKRPSVGEPAKPEVEDSYWGSRNAEEKTASKSLQPSNSYSDLRPIEAPADYQSPFARRWQSPRAAVEPVADEELSAPPLLPRPADDKFDLRGTNSASVRVSVPVREATVTRSKTITPVTRVRDTGGWQAND